MQLLKKLLLYAVISSFFFIFEGVNSREISSNNSSNFEYKAKDFSYLLGKLKGIDSSLLEMHFKLYEGYVKNTNTLLANLQEMRESNQERTLGFGALKRRFGWEYDGMYLHELYFENLSPHSKISPRSPIYKKIVQDFGSFESWEKDFVSTGMIRGIGWVILYQDPVEKKLYNCWINEHDLGHLAGGKPLLVMDVWEHAYITEYGLNRGGYIQAFLRNVNWDEVEMRLEGHKNNKLEKNNEKIK